MTIIFHMIISTFLISGYSFSTELENTFSRNLPSIKSLVMKLEEEENIKNRCVNEDGDLLIDYSRMQVCDVYLIGSLHYSKVQDEIDYLCRLGVLFNRPVILNLEGNYLQDSGVEGMVDFILGRTLLRDQLKIMNLSNNRFSSQSLSKLKILVDGCANLEELDISVNYIDSKDVWNTFCDTKHKNVVRFVPY